jgi:class 3 adenylate cyclase
VVLEPAGRRLLKGFDEPVEVYSLASIGTGPS